MFKVFQLAPMDSESAFVTKIQRKNLLDQPM